MTDDDLAAIIAVGWEMDPDEPGVIDAVKGTTHFATIRLRFAVDEAAVHVEQALEPLGPLARLAARALWACRSPRAFVQFHRERRRP